MTSPDKETNLSAFLTLRFAAGGPPATAAISQRLGAVLAWSANLAGLSPSNLTTLAGFFSAGGAISFAILPISISGSLLAVCLLQIAYALDCADGQLARATGRSSEFGAWYDVVMDFMAIHLLGFAIVFFLLSQGADTVLALCAGFTLTCGRTIGLYSATRFRLEKKPSIRPKTFGKSIIRWILVTSIDLPVILLLLCATRSEPAMLITTALITGTLAGLHGIYIGIKSFR